MTKYHFIGIKGSGMSALAQILDDMGYDVQGSDYEKYYFTQKPLEQRGIPIFPFHRDNIKEGLHVIAGNAFKDDHEEIQRSYELNVPLSRYHQFLGAFTQKFTSVAVTGAHGKTSTTGLLAHTFKGIKPTSYLIGDGTGEGKHNSDYFVFEACEYRRHFLAYNPDYMVVTNIDFDHPDYFSNVDDVVDAFKSLAKQVKKGIVACGDDDYVEQLQTNVPVIFYGLDDNNDLQAYNIQSSSKGTSFDVRYKGEQLGTFLTPLYGKHNVQNALAVIGVAIFESLPLNEVNEELKTFGGVKRRFSDKVHGEYILIDDYAHHPTEIKATIDAVRSKYPQKEVVSVFQPHTFTRTEAFLNEFAEALSESDHVYLCEIFSSARERKGNLSISDLQSKVNGSHTISTDSIHKLNSHKGSVILFMGAGDIQKFQDAFEKLGIEN